ncbi:hypothetical protein ACVWXS_002920 [Lysinibacillus sp. TE18511]
MIKRSLAKEFYLCESSNSNKCFLRENKVSAATMSITSLL